MTVNPCPAADWSPAASAESAAQLAAVLAGFVFAGLVLLLSDSRSGSMRVPTIGHFFGAFIVLALSSYLFGLITGDTQDAGCKRVWTAMVIASGLFGLGAFAIISGITWLLAAYLVTNAKEVEADGSSRALRRLSQIISISVYGVIAVVAALMAATVYSYFFTWYTHPPTWIGIAAAAYAPALLLIVFLARMMRSPHRDTPDRLVDAMFLGNLIAVSYALIGSLYVGVVVSMRVSDWQRPSAAWLVVTALLALLVPAPSLVCLAYAVPSLSRNRVTTPEEPASPTASPLDTVAVPDSGFLIIVRSRTSRRRKPPATP